MSKDKRLIANLLLCQGTNTLSRHEENKVEIIETELEMEGATHLLGLLLTPWGKWNAIVEDSDLKLSQASVRVRSSDAKNPIVFILNQIASALNHECVIRSEEAARISDLRTLYHYWAAAQQSRLSYFKKTVTGWRFVAKGGSFTLLHRSKGGRIEIEATEDLVFLSFDHKLGYASVYIYADPTLRIQLMLNRQFALYETEFLEVLLNVDMYALEGIVATFIAQKAALGDNYFSALLPRWQRIAAQQAELEKSMAQAEYDDFDQVSDLLDGRTNNEEE